MLPCMSRRVAPTLNATGPKKEASFCKKPCLASMDPLSVCVCMLALVVAVLIAYDMSAEGNFQQACFWGLKTKHFWLRGCGPSLYIKLILMYRYIVI